MRRSPWAREYARTPGTYLWGREPSAFARAVGPLLRPGARVVELGCGEGRDSVFFARLGSEVTGVDLSAAGLRKAERLAREHRVRVAWVRGDMTLVLLRPPVHLVYSCGTVHYVPRDRRAPLFRRLKRLTPPGGYHAHLVFTDREIYVEKGELADYFAPGELARAYADWLIVRARAGTIPCAQDGKPHRHSVEELVAQAPPRP